MAGDEYASDWAAVLRQRGFRVTPQRQLVLTAVDALGHATPEEIHEHVRAQAAGVNLSTVYRTLEVLEGVGLVTHAHIAHGSPTYHSMRTHQHVHLVCRSCNGVESIPAEQVTPLVERLVVERGFTPDVGHLTVHGTCARCSGGAS
jgi:Fur family transcriptional regulator, ferric uptake regulator